MKKTNKEVQAKFDKWGYCLPKWKKKAEQKDREEIL